MKLYLKLETITANSNLKYEKIFVIPKYTIILKYEYTTNLYKKFWIFQISDEISGRTRPEGQIGILA